MYVGIVKSSTRQVIGNNTEFVINWSWNEITVEGEGLSSVEKKKILMIKSGTTTKV